MIIDRARNLVRRLTGTKQNQMMLQEHFLRSALKELGLTPREDQIKIDHVLGTNEAYGLKFGLKYPKSYLAKTDAIPIDRKYKYAFSGNMSPSGRRKEMLAPFVRPDSLVEEDNYGRDPNKKYEFNTEYYTLLRSSYFSLCPHQADWKGAVETMWTYRFIESTFSRTLPVVFRLAPCGAPFLSGFVYYWDDEAHDLEGYEDKLDINRRVAEERFFFTADEARQLKAAAKL